MTTKDIEEFVEEIRVEMMRMQSNYDMEETPDYYDDELCDIITRKLTTLTQRHQAEVRREKQELINQLLKSLPLRSDWDDDEKVTFEKVVYAMRETLESYDFTPTTPDKQ